MEGRVAGSSKAKSLAANPNGTAASVARPIPQPAGAMRALSPQVITSCANSMFVESGGGAVNPPYTVTLMDKTPSTGQSGENGVVDALGIHGHRVEKTIRLKIDIQDASGRSSQAPVLVHLTLAGPHHGTLILGSGRTSGGVRPGEQRCRN